MAKYKLDDLCEFITDGTHQTPEYCEEGGVIFLSSKDVTERKINWDDVKHIPDSLHEKLYKRLRPQKNDILLAKNGTTGVAAIVDRDEIFDIYVSLAVLRPIKSIYPKYLLYAINSPVAKRQFDAGLKGIGVPNLHLGVIRETVINVAEREEQELICETLDKVAGIIDKRKAELNALDDLIKARFVEMFGDPVMNEKGWITKSLLDMGRCKNGMNFHYDDEGVEINCLGVGDFKELSIIDNTDELPTVSLKEMPSEEYLLKDDDIVFVRSNGNKALVGRSIAVYPGNVPTTFSGFCIRYRKHDNEIIVPYLLRALKADSMRMKMTGRGANIQNLNQQILGTLVIPIPPLDLQNQFADFVHQVDKLKLQVQKSLDETQTLFDSLMQQYFG